MIGVPLEPGFFARELLQMPFRAFGATLLQALTKSMMPLTVLFNGFTTESFPFAVCSQVDDTKINTEGIRRLIGSRGRDIEGDSQVECPVAIEQISLPFDGIQTGLLIASHTEGNEDATRERQERNGSQSLEGHDSLIIDDSPFRLKAGLNALISLIHIGCFADGPNSQLSRQMIGGTKLTIGHFLQLELIGDLSFKRLGSHIVTRCIKGVQSIKQGLSLLRCRSEFQKHGLFHGLSIARLRDIVRWARNKERTSSPRSEEHTSELQSQSNLVCRLLLDKK